MVPHLQTVVVVHHLREAFLNDVAAVGPQHIVRGELGDLASDHLVENVWLRDVGAERVLSQRDQLAYVFIGHLLLVDRVG